MSADDLRSSMSRHGIDAPDPLLNNAPETPYGKKHKGEQGPISIRY